MKLRSCAPMLRRQLDVSAAEGLSWTVTREASCTTRPFSTDATNDLHHLGSCVMDYLNDVEEVIRAFSE
eukprot:scaffold346810_cov41-Prasinocladus_malaysianus.AAC.1